MKYHKIETLFERDLKTFKVNPDILKSPVIGTIKEWDVTEKINGTNIRVMLALDGTVSFGGRTNNAQIPGDLVQHLVKTFTPEKLQAVMWIDGTPCEVVLYGEGYGAGIQKVGSGYRPDKSFILFDVLVGGRWWLNDTNMRDVANKLGIEAVPYLGRMTLDNIVANVQVPFKSQIGVAMAEGIVARPIEPLFDKRMRRVIIKLKTKDFTGGK